MLNALIGGWCTIPLLILSGLIYAAQWTIGVYMCADNGMNDQAYSDIAEMLAVGSTAEVNIVVQVDNAAWDTNPSCRRYHIKKNQKELLRDLGEVDMADTSTLAEFIGFLKNSFPARNYFLIIWDHGNGWRAGYGPQQAVLIDESHSHMMGVAGGELANALRLGTKKLGRKLTIIGFDACLMGSIEIAGEVMPYCDFLLASEGLVGWDGFPYDDFLSAFTTNPNAPLQELQTKMCADYVARSAGDDACLSAVSLGQLKRSLDGIGRVLKKTNPQSANFRLARQQVQTFPTDAFRPPVVTDEQIDFIHFWQLSGIEEMDRALESLVVANATTANYRKARGLAAWFPYRYLAFKKKADEYGKLAFSTLVPWLSFLNNYFGRDDVKPTPPEITAHKTGNRGDVRLWWSKSYDLAPVTCELYRATAPEVVLLDPGNSLDAWSPADWTISTRQFRSPPTAFFSGSLSHLNNQLTLNEPLNLPAGGLLSFYAYYLTEETEDSLGRPVRDVCYLEWSKDKNGWQCLDSLYGTTDDWQEFRYLLPPSPHMFLRLRYATNPAVNLLGVFIDDISVQAFAHLFPPLMTAETTAYLFNLFRDTSGYQFFVRAIDSFGNVSMVSQFYPVKVKTWAEPYTRPAPFAERCKIVLDFPEGENPNVLIFTLSGTLLKRFPRVTSREIDWDGRNEHGKQLADGVYIVVVQGKHFKKIGKIARVRVGAVREPPLLVIPKATI